MNLQSEESAPKKSFLPVPLQGLSLAFSFLTRLPSAGVDWERQSVWSWSFAFYPLVGAVLGAVATIPTALLCKFPVSESLILLSVLFYLAALEWQTRFLHFDGFCDCSDAFNAASASKERRLEIMKDPHVGAAAVGSAALLFLGKGLTLYLLVLKGTIFLDNPVRTLAMLVAIPVMARLSMLFLAAWGNYPRESGTAMRVVGRVPLAALLFATVSALPLLWLVGIAASVPLLILCGSCMIFWKVKSSSKIGGVTGDVLGACCESSELVAAIALLLALEVNL